MRRAGLGTLPSQALALPAAAYCCSTHSPGQGQDSVDIVPNPLQPTPPQSDLPARVFAGSYVDGASPTACWGPQQGGRIVSCQVGSRNCTWARRKRGG